MKVFRAFRQKGINEGVVKKYLLYAIGEIVLVVIGILIALSINNWNNDREKRKSEEKVYRNIQKEIGEHKAELLGVISYSDQFAEQWKYALQIITEKDQNRLDTLARIMPNLFRYSDFNVSNSIYKNLVNSGDINLITNDIIIEGLQSLDESYIFINRLEANHFQAIMKFVGPGIVDNIHYRTLEVERPEDLYSFEFENLIIAFLDIVGEKDEGYQEALMEMDSINKLIIIELEQ